MNRQTNSVTNTVKSISSGFDGRKPFVYRENEHHGAWRSSVARLLWEQEVPGSNPGAPICCKRYM